ncbi:hypothetical protein JF535_13375 [Microbulbifer salipaludis]|uniref:Uncharacterized protein n=1 Tax=Microbulbifer salipaludis TaxID=187980 RepID=A0ABS3E948_9GAMM|nr:hypothetical protein [Microbulbifer salipaludis]MBN8431843.1 hypothetical protein [Microbulbifer salipaludis]
MYNLNLGGPLLALVIMAVLGAATALWSFGSWISEPNHIELKNSEWTCSKVIPAQQLGEVPTCAEYRRHKPKQVEQ